MENADTEATMSITKSPHAPIMSSSSQPQIGNHVHYVQHVVVSPCAACKILKRKCAEKCVLAPYFPPRDPLKFTTAHRVFGASNIIKFLQELPEDQRDDAVSSMVYEANARLSDPVYGCAGAIFHLQKEVNELQAQLAKAHVEMTTMQCHQANLTALLCMEIDRSQQELSPLPQDCDSYINVDMFQGYDMDDHINLGSFWRPSFLDTV